VRRAAALVVLLLLAAATGVASAADPEPPAPASTVAAQPQFSMDEIEREIMCPTCETPLYLSHSPAANRIRAYVAEKRDAGWTKQQVKDRLVQDFGQEILAVPERSGLGLAAWVVPLLVVLCGLAVAIGVAVVWRRRSGGGGSSDGGAPADDALSPALDARVDAALADYDRG
jgi:cytochrome c-type biogenesis protein CcmH